MTEQKIEQRRLHSVLYALFRSLFDVALSLLILHAFCCTGALQHITSARTRLLDVLFRRPICFQYRRAAYLTEERG